MVGPNPHAPIRVLMYDPQHRVIQPLARILDEQLQGRGKVAFTSVETLNSILQEVVQRTAPHYSLVVYASSQAKQEGSAGVIAKVQKHDYFLPQMVVGPLEMGLAARCARAGVLYYAQTEEELQAETEKVFQKVKLIPHLTIVKIGGSAFDFVRQIGNGANVEKVCEILTRMHQDREKWEEVRSGIKRKVRKLEYRMLVTAGAGQHGDVVKDLVQAHSGHAGMQEHYPKAIAQALQANLEYLKALFGDVAALLSTGAFYYISESTTRKKIPLIDTAPHYIMARDRIPLQDSDTHTVALAEFYGAEKVILVKRTDGIYDFDPYRGLVLDPYTKQCANVPAWREAQQHNRRHTLITVEDLLLGRVSREGTSMHDGKADGSTGHLMEDSALQYFAGCRDVKEILVVHIAPEEMHHSVENNQWRHVVTGEEVTVNGNAGWTEILEKNIKDAFQGKACSKIVRS